MKYTGISDEFGVAKYSSEKYDIVVERGALSHNRPTGYSVYNKSGKCLEPSLMTLREAKDYIERISKEI